MAEALRVPRGFAPRSLPRTSTPAADEAPAGPIAASKPAVARRAVEARRPYHVGVFLGVSAGLYAVSLAGVTALQSSAERAVAAGQAPTVAAVEALGAGHDALERRLASGGSAYEAAAARYARTAESLAALERQLDSLATSVGKVAGVASHLPAHVALPSLPQSMPVFAAAAPVVHATTGASGKP
jgi:hypothetical protein